jgi:hypothetical protein
MRLERYINRLLDTIYSRRDFAIEYLEWNIGADERGGFIGARLRYWDDSLLEFDETVIVEYDIVLNKVSYSYHYQSADGTMIVRYDNAPHHPELPGFPDHVHRPGGVEPADPPDLSDVLREIDGHLYGREST